MSGEDTQEQFDWMEESAKCVEGLKFDLDQRYTFDLIFEEVSLHPLKRKDGTVITYQKGERAGQPVRMFTIPFKEIASNVTFKLDFFANENYRVNPENPELEDEIVKFSRKLGYNPVLDGNFALKDFITPGIRITAMLKEQELTEDQKKAGKKAYNQINIDTIELDGEGGGEIGGQQNIEDVPEDVQKKVQDAVKASKAKKFQELSAYLSKTKKFDLIEPALRMKEQGLLKVA
jgi:hypothetical protein